MIGHFLPKRAGKLQCHGVYGSFGLRVGHASLQEWGVNGMTIGPRNEARVTARHRRAKFFGALVGMAFAMSASLVPAQAAATIALLGPYGNEAGCRFAATDDFSDDSLLLLTADAVSTFTTSCAFTSVSATERGFAVQVLCDHEGEEAQTSGSMRVEKAAGGVDAFEIFDEDGRSWGKVGRCS